MPVLRLRIPTQRWTKKRSCIIIAYCNKFEIFKSEFVKRKTIRYAFEFVVRASIQFLRRSNRSRELGRVNGTALLGPKRYFFIQIARSLISRMCALSVSFALWQRCVGLVLVRPSNDTQRDVKIKSNQFAMILIF